MIQANELRVGNKINYFREIHTLQTVGLWLHTDLSSDEIPLDQCKPIPLTEEWLIRFGFKFDKNTGLYHKSGFDIGFVKDGYIEFYLAEYGSWFRCLEFVHQLQNLYFALTGEEL